MVDEPSICSTNGKVFGAARAGWTPPRWATANEWKTAADRV